MCWGQPGECPVSTCLSNICPSFLLQVVQPVNFFFTSLILQATDVHSPGISTLALTNPLPPVSERTAPLQVSGAKAPVWGHQKWMQTSGFSKQILPELQAKSSAAFSLSLGGGDKTLDPRCFIAEHLYKAFSSLPEECHMAR